MCKFKISCRKTSGPERQWTERSGERQKRQLKASITHQDRNQTLQKLDRIFNKEKGLCGVIISTTFKNDTNKTNLTGSCVCET